MGERVRGRMGGSLVNDEEEEEEKYLIVDPGNGGIRDVFRYGILGNKASGGKFLKSSDDDDDEIHGWVITVSIIMMKLMKLFAKPMECTGYILDFLLNFISLNSSPNNSFLAFLSNLLQGTSIPTPTPTPTHMISISIN